MRSLAVTPLLVALICAAPSLAACSKDSPSAKPATADGDKAKGEAPEKAAEPAAPENADPHEARSEEELAAGFVWAFASGKDENVDRWMATEAAERAGCADRWAGDKAERAAKGLARLIPIARRRAAECRALGAWSRAKLVEVTGGGPRETQVCDKLTELRHIEAVYELPSRKVRMTLFTPRRLPDGTMTLAGPPKCHDEDALDAACQNVSKVLGKDVRECRMIIRGPVKDDPVALRCMAAAKTAADIKECAPKRPGVRVNPARDAAPSKPPVNRRMPAPDAERAPPRVPNVPASKRIPPPDHKPDK